MYGVFQKPPLSEKCPYFKFFWSAFSRIWTEYQEMRSISPYSVRIRENTDQKLRIRTLFTHCIFKESWHYVFLLNLFLLNSCSQTTPSSKTISEKHHTQVWANLIHRGSFFVRTILLACPIKPTKKWARKTKLHIQSRNNYKHWFLFFIT